MSDIGRAKTIASYLAACAASLVLSVSVLASETSVTDAEHVNHAVNNLARPEKDRALDAMRKPAEILRFFGLKPGMDVLDIFSGGGYYSEIVSYVVQDSGSVTMYNNSPWLNFVATQLEERLKDERLPNVSTLVLAPATLVDHKKKYDAAIVILGMHDIYHEDMKNDWPLIDKQLFLTGIFESLRPGGIFGVIDHNGEQGRDVALDSKSLHRVAPDVLIKDIESVGFELVASSDLLANPNDNKTTSVFLPENRWKTDRSVLRFRKP